MLRRLVGDWLSVIGAHLPGDEERKPRIRGIEPARALGDWPGARVVFWSVEVEGLGELGRLRLAWPLDALTRPVEPAKARGPAPGDPLHGLLLDAPVVLCAEVGTADVSLSRLAGLEVGDVLPIDVRDDGRLIVRIEGRPKFDAIRGAVGNRAAIQIVGCRAASGGEQRG